MRILPYRPRFLNRLFAKSRGLFWLPCPICGRWFGGHEWSETLRDTFLSGHGVCPKCGKKALALNEAKFPGRVRHGIRASACK